MACALVVIFASLGIMQTLWGSASSSLLGSRGTTNSTNTVDAAQQVGKYEYCFSCKNIEEACYNHTHLLQFKASFASQPLVTRMGIMHSNNMLYYAFVPKFEDTDDSSQVAYVSLIDKNDYGVIKSYRLSFEAFDINQKQNKVYLGGIDGIWCVNSTSFIPTLCAADGKRVNSIVSQDYVYYTEYDRPGIFINVSNDIFILQDKAIENFVFDKSVNYNIVYLADNGYIYIWFHSKTQQKRDSFSTRSSLKGLTVDMKGAVYTWDVDGIYKVFLDQNGLSEAKLVQVSAIAPDAMTFDSENNILYSIGDNLYKLTKVSEVKVTCYGN